MKKARLWPIHIYFVIFWIEYPVLVMYIISFVIET